jgi:hypothetical protein
VGVLRGKVATIPLLMPLTFLVQVYANLFDDEGDEITPRALRS